MSSLGTVFLEVAMGAYQVRKAILGLTLLVSYFGVICFYSVAGVAAEGVTDSAVIQVPPPPAPPAPAPAIPGPVAAPAPIVLPPASSGAPQGPASPVLVPAAPAAPVNSGVIAIPAPPSPGVAPGPVGVVAPPPSGKPGMKRELDSVSRILSSNHKCKVGEGSFNLNLHSCDRQANGAVICNVRNEKYGLLPDSLRNIFEKEAYIRPAGQNWKIVVDDPKILAYLCFTHADRKEKARYKSTGKVLSNFEDRFDSGRVCTYPDGRSKATETTAFHLKSKADAWMKRGSNSKFASMSYEQMVDSCISSGEKKSKKSSGVVSPVPGSAGSGVAPAAPIGPIAPSVPAPPAPPVQGSSGVIAPQVPAPPAPPLTGKR